MRSGLISLVFLSCIACTRLQNSAERESQTRESQTRESQANVALKQAAPVADRETSAGFECTDGTFSTSLDACLISMANKRLPPSQQVDGSSIKPAAAATEKPAGATR
jgi:hypothetical protein